MSCLLAATTAPGRERQALEPTLPAAHDALLRTISQGLDIRDVFPRVAQIASRVVNHDCLELVVHDHLGKQTALIRSSSGTYGNRALTTAHRHEWSVIGDPRYVDDGGSGDSQAERRADLAAAGYRSALSIRAVANGHELWLGFMSRQLNAFTAADVPAARLIADCMAVAVSHEQLAQQLTARAERRVRAECRDTRIQAARAPGDRSGEPSLAIGQSVEWRQVLRKAALVAATDTTVFIHGESGTGKEVVAQFIHRASSRKDGPFVAINCAALPDQLLESELFGYERGAFTGANTAKPGRIELAAAGVLFLDEVSEISVAAQAKLLRFLQEREIQRLGGTRLVRTNVRVIAASNRDLYSAVADGTFREDLYYRLQVFDISIPPLRERPGDVPLLAEDFLRVLSMRTHRAAATLSDSAKAALVKHDWPGNVRQLHNVLERAAILSEGEPIALEHLSLNAEKLRAPRTDLPEVERRTIEQVLRETESNKSRAARRLGITRTQLYGRLRKYGLA